MKKYLIALLALVMMFALSVPALAEVTPTGNTEQDVTADYTAGESKNAGTIYSVTIEWTQAAGTSLSYTGKKATYTWDPEGLQYKEEVTENVGWAGETGYTVKVTNRSNATVDAELSATANYGLTLAKPEDEKVTLDSAAVTDSGDAIEFTNTTDTGKAQVKEFTYTYSAGAGATEPTNVTGSSVSIGTITVTVTGE